MKANLPIRRLGWDDKIEAGDFHALSATPSGVCALTSEEAIGKTVREWRRETGTNEREFFRVDAKPINFYVVSE